MVYLKKIKDGVLFIGQYKTRVIPIMPPHVIVFSNDPPKLEIINKDTDTSDDTMSRDRWHIVNTAESHDVTKSKDLRVGRVAELRLIENFLLVGSNHVLMGTSQWTSSRVPSIGHEPILTARVHL